MTLLDKFRIIAATCLLSFAEFFAHAVYLDFSVYTNLGYMERFDNDSIGLFWLAPID